MTDEEEDIALPQDKPGYIENRNKKLIETLERIVSGVAAHFLDSDRVDKWNIYSREGPCRNGHQLSLHYSATDREEQEALLMASGRISALLEPLGVQVRLLDLHKETAIAIRGQTPAKIITALQKLYDQRKQLPLTERSLKAIQEGMDSSAQREGR